MTDISRYPRPAVAVDLVIFTIQDADLRLLLIERDRPPFKGRWTLPGGFVRVGQGEDQGEDLEVAAARELAEETGLPRGSVYLEQLGAFGKAGRDPRLRVISVAWFALVKPELAPFVRAGGDASGAAWFSAAALDPDALAFDHAEILRAALARVRRELHRGPIAFELVPEAFSIAELRAVFEVILGERLDPGNFRRRVLRMIDDGVLEQAPGKRITASKPARVYRFVREPAGGA